jgi:hypothetical protein
MFYCHNVRHKSHMNGWYHTGVCAATDGRLTARKTSHHTSCTFKSVRIWNIKSIYWNLSSVPERMIATSEIIWHPKIKQLKCKIKAIPVQAHRDLGAWGFQNFQTSSTWRWQHCQLYAPAAFTPQETSLVFISITRCADPLDSMKHFDDPNGYRNRSLPSCRAVLQPRIPR